MKKKLISVFAILLLILNLITVMPVQAAGERVTVEITPDKTEVKAGDTIYQGTPVLKVGSTGYSTGPHAHFEVRINGEYVQPLDYITSYSAETQTQETGTETSDENNNNQEEMDLEETNQNNEDI